MITPELVQRAIDAYSERFGKPATVSTVPAPLDACPDCLSHDNRPQLSIAYGISVTGIYLCPQCGRWWSSAWSAAACGLGHAANHATSIGDGLQETLDEIRQGRSPFVGNIRVPVDWSSLTFAPATSTEEDLR